jgi:hypothetical protein
LFDNIRDSNDSYFYEEEQNDLYKEQPVVANKSQSARAQSAPRVKSRQRRNNARFLGMTAQQRFILSLMLMFMVCIMGTMAMFVLGKMSIF